MDGDVKMYREHSPYFQLLSKIPTRIHRGMRGYDLDLTCISAHPKFVVLGTNAGLVYWYDRGQDDLQRLWCTDRRTPISKLSLVETVDLMLAVGNLEGCITIFQIPRPLDTTVLPPLLTQVTSNPGCLEGGAEFFTIPGIHSKPITALAWAPNGMKLFSGDEQGQVSLTTIDFVARSTSSRPLCKEGAKIVQLSYARPWLLISSVERSIVIDTSKADLEPMVVGERVRQKHGHYGGIFGPGSPKKARVLAVRPRNTLYSASVEDATCKVDSTILLESILKRPHMDIPLINPMIFHQDLDLNDDINLLQPLLHDDGISIYYVAYNSSVLHIINPSKPAVLASCCGLRGIIDLSTCSSSGSDKINHDEIFVLEGPRTLVRISLAPDVFQHDKPDPFMNPLGPDVTEGLGLESVGPNLMSMSASVVSKLPNLEGASFLASSATNAITNLGGKLFWSSQPGEETSEVEEATEVKATEDQDDLEFLFGDDGDDTQRNPASFGRLSLELVTPEGASSSSGYDGIPLAPNPEKEKSLIAKLNLGSYFQTSVAQENVKGPMRSSTESDITKELKWTTKLSSIRGEHHWTTFDLPIAQPRHLFGQGPLLYVLGHDESVHEGTLDEDKIHWRKLRFEATDLAVSPNGCILWRISNCKVYSREDPMGDDFIEVTDQAHQVRVADEFGVVLTHDGALDMYLDIHKPSLLYQKSQRIEFDAIISRMDVSPQLIAVVSESKLFLRSGMTQSDFPGLCWCEIATLKMDVQDVRVSLDLNGTSAIHKILVLSTDNQLIFTQGNFDYICYDPRHQWMELNFLGSRISSDETFTFSLFRGTMIVGSNNDSSAYLAQDLVHASYWETVRFTQIKSRIKEIQANGIFEQEGVLWVTLFSMKPNRNDVFYTKFHDHQLHQVSHPPTLNTPISALAASPEALWILSSQGEIFIRTGIRPAQSEGLAWEKLDMSQLEGSGDKLEHIALGWDVVWALDTTGSVWFRLGSLLPEDMVPAWVQLEDSSQRFLRISCSASIHMVWAIDHEHQVFVRDGIYPDFRQGVGWIQVGGIGNAVDIVASDSFIWVLTLEGALHRRTGITKANFLGEVWESIPLMGATLTSISATFCDTAIGVDKRGRIIKLCEDDLLLHPQTNQ
eukprot:maker-scaffold387_size188669-snap-gene-0.19 protein:Tk03877 transcript:maker-scaffold387_size188669-snap-gene-0.19-mRNA-1 annotation:"wd repeat-containing protein cg11141"